MQTKTFTVPNISCGHCVMTIKNELSDLPGVTSVSGDQAAKTVTVSWDDPATWDQIKALLIGINYPAADAN